MILILIPLILILALFGVPLFIALSGFAFLGFHAAQIPLPAFIVEVYRMTSAPALLAIPLFIFAGTVLARSNAPQRLVGFTDALFGWIPGGLALVSIVVCAFFTAFTGASGITIVALGGILYPALIKRTYPERFSLGLLTTSGSIGLLFPPSLPVILYAVVAKVNIDQLFLAGLIPGLILVTTMAIYSGKVGMDLPQAKNKLSFTKIKKAMKNSAWELPLPFMILGGIYGGIFTATEAASVTAAYVLIVEVLIQKDIHWKKDLPNIMKESAVLTGCILIILSAALGLTNYLIDQQVPMKILDWMRGFITHKLYFLMLLNVFLVVVGCLIDIFSAIVVVVPLIVPIAMSFGVDPLHLGIIFLVNLEMGYSTPPVGINLFLSSMRFEKPMTTLYRSVLPFLILRILALAAITYLPFLSLWLIR
ncbi:TRAP transporter large permease [Elusimicrobiota bacterium]